MSSALADDRVDAAAPGVGGAPPRVLFVNHSSRLGGAEFILLANLRGFDERSAVWLFEDGPLRERLRGVAVRTLMPSRPSGFTDFKRDSGGLLSAAPLLGGMVRMMGGIVAAARRHDLVYANSQKAFVLSAPAAALARRPLVWHLHDILTPAHFGASQLRLLRRLANRPARVIVPSRAAAEAYVALGGEARRVVVVPNGVTLEPDGTEGLDRPALRARLGLPDGTGFLFGVFSRLSPWKGQEVALRTLALRPDLHCVIAGDALFGEDAYAASLRRLTAELGVADRAHFLGHRSDVPALMRAVDAVVHPSIEPEPFGRTLVEAMLCRTPVIAAASGAAPEILVDGTGLLVPPGDPEALAVALDEVRAETMRTRERVVAGEARALALYTERGMREGIAAVVRDVAGGVAR